MNLLDEMAGDLSSPEEGRGEKKEDKPLVPLSNPIAMYGELNPQSKLRRSTSRRRELPKRRGKAADGEEH